MKTILPGAILVIAIAGCGNPFGDDSHPTIQTDATNYEVRETDLGLGISGGIGFVFTNPLPDTVYVVRCSGGPAIERLTGQMWLTVWAPLAPACLSRPIVIPGGAPYIARTYPWAGNSSTNLYPKFLMSDFSGEYRLVWRELVTSYDINQPSLGKPLPLEQRVSNRFTLSLER